MAQGEPISDLRNEIESLRQFAESLRDSVADLAAAMSSGKTGAAPRVAGEGIAGPSVQDILSGAGAEAQLREMVDLLRSIDATVRGIADAGQQ